jgi:ubiquinone/menaquinone biosynthesis C-methylase UbiE
MKPGLQRRIQRYGWDRAAADYQSSWSRQLAPAQKLLLDMADLQAGERVLDVACGTGLVTLPAAEAVGERGHVVATDISDGMLAAAHDAAALSGTNWITFVRAGAEDPAPEYASFDASLCALGLMYVPEPESAVREMRRALRSGGRSVIAVWGERRNCGWSGIFPVVDERVNTEVCPLFFDLGAGRVGYQDVTSERIQTTLDYATGEEAVSAAFAGGPVAMAYSRFDETTKAEAHAAYLETIRPYRNGAGYQIPGEFVVVRGVASTTR